MIKLKTGWFIFLFTFFPMAMLAQETQVKGKVIEVIDQSPLPEVQIGIEKSNIYAETNSSGEFLLQGSELPRGEQVLTIYLEGYESKRYPIVIYEGEVLDLGELELEPSLADEDIGIAQIILSDEQLDSEMSSASNVSGLLSSSKDTYFRAAAFDFSSTFFKPRGLDNEYGKVLINGIEMNSVTTGRPEFASFGGLNDVKRNEVFYEGLSANPHQFGGIAGTTNSIMRASKYWAGGKVQYAQSNRSYRGSMVGTYSSGLMANGWAYTVLASRRFGNHGFQEGTSYNANSFFASVEKVFNEKHSLNFTGFFTPNNRGKSSAMTEEVKDLKGIHYNPYWGDQEGNPRNARMKRVEEPTIMLNHYWDISPNTSLNTNVAYRFGEIGNTRIDNGGTRLIEGPDGQKVYIGGAKNPAPDYYQNLPSYHLRYDYLDASNFQSAYLAQQEFINNGQLDWHALYEANEIAKRTGGYSTYILQEEREDNQSIIANSILSTTLTDHIKLNAALNYRKFSSENFSMVKDLLGGAGYLDVDFFADEPSEVSGLVTDLAQSDLNNPDRIVRNGDRYKYNYNIESDYGSAFAQAEFNYRKVDFFLAGDISRTTYQRDGKYRNGHFPNNSFGKGEKLEFTNFGAKGGALFKLTGQHMIRANAAYLTKAPSIRNAYPNARQSAETVIGLSTEKISTADVSYIYRSHIIKARATGFYSGINDATQIGHYFTQGLSGMGENNDAALVHEVTTGIDMRNMGIEFGIEAQVLPTVTLKAAGSIGQSVYTNNPNLYLTSQDFSMKNLHGAQRDFAEQHEGVPVIFGDGTTKIKNYHVAGGPERAFQIGFEYRDPDFWFVGATANFFSHGYVDINKLRRTSNFTTDIDGITFADYDEDRARELLRQDKLGDYFLINMIGGKTWRVGDYTIGVFGVLSNLLNQEYKTGGFESGRKANFANFNQDMSSPYGEQFGNNYFYGFGTTFYLSTYVRF